MIEYAASRHILMSGDTFGADWAYLLFILGISVLSWLANLVKKHREGKTEEILHPEDVVTDVEEVLEDEPPPPQRPPAPLPSPVPIRPAPPPPVAKPVQRVQPPPVPPRPLPQAVPPGVAVVVPRLAQLRPKPTTTPAAEAVLHAQPAVKPSLPVVPRSNVLDRKALRRAIVMAEILDRPIALRQGHTADSF